MTTLLADNSLLSKRLRRPHVKHYIFWPGILSLRVYKKYMPPTLSIVIPCYNEEKRIGKTLDIIHAYVTRQSFPCEVLVVDNGSKDNTRTVVEEAMKRMPELRLVRHRSYGKGWAVKEGMLEARGEYRLFTDADNSTDISQADKLLAYTKQGYDVVISSRRIEGAVITNPQPWYRNILGTAFAFLIRSLIPLGIKDTQNGFKLFTKKAAEVVFPRQAIYFWAFDVEILAIAKQKGFKIKEVPIVWVNDDRSTMSIRGMIRMLVEVINIRLMLFTKK